MLFGAVTVVLIILSLAGNLGGDFASVIDPLLLQLVIESSRQVLVIQQFLQVLLLC